MNVTSTFILNYSKEIEDILSYVSKWHPDARAHKASHGAVRFYIYDKRERLSAELIKSLRASYPAAQTLLNHYAIVLVSMVEDVVDIMDLEAEYVGTDHPEEKRQAGYRLERAAIVVFEKWEMLRSGDPQPDEVLKKLEDDERMRHGNRAEDQRQRELKRQRQKEEASLNRRARMEIR